MHLEQDQSSDLLADDRQAQLQHERRVAAAFENASNSIAMTEDDDALSSQRILSPEDESAHRDALGRLAFGKLPVHARIRRDWSDNLGEHLQKQEAHTSRLRENLTARLEAHEQAKTAQEEARAQSDIQDVQVAKDAVHKAAHNNNLAARAAEAAERQTTRQAYLDRQKLIYGTFRLQREPGLIEDVEAAADAHVTAIHGPARYAADDTLKLAAATPYAEQNPATPAAIHSRVRGRLSWADRQLERLRTHSYNLAAAVHFRSSRNSLKRYFTDPTPEGPIYRGARRQIVAVVAGAAIVGMAAYLAAKNYVFTEQAPLTGGKTTGSPDMTVHKQGFDSAMQQMHDRAHAFLELPQYNPATGNGTVWNLVGDHTNHLGLHQISPEQHQLLVQRTLDINHLNWDTAKELRVGAKVKMLTAAEIRDLLAK